ncbi:membrane protein of unknown function [Tenacibaculum jejuense]|uniref:Transmembrane protein n=1 Tax=Tenacibaculum jejuense TaxID=584609 RepID=A0A238U7F9_9FLAO|nr:membrane protein of unknown function [Tenacibaculum jejuense]
MYFSRLFFVLLTLLFFVFLTSFRLRKKDKTKATILFFLGVYGFIFLFFYFRFVRIGYLGFLFSMVIIPVMVILTGVYYKEKDKKVSRFLYRLATFIIVAYIVGLGLCLSLLI